MHMIVDSCIFISALALNLYGPLSLITIDNS